MENSILTSTKQILNISAAYTNFDLDIITHINSTFSIISQLGIGPDGGYMITDASSHWSELAISNDQLNIIKTYVFLRVRMLFDPPTSGFLLDAMKQQISEYEYRLSYLREATQPIPTVQTNPYANDDGYAAGYYQGLADAMLNISTG
jgi:hypothetical protein